MPSFIPYFGVQSDTSYFGFIIQPLFKAYATLRDFYGGWKASRYRKAVGMNSLWSFSAFMAFFMENQSVNPS